jgi:hypothetical protein
MICPVHRIIDTQTFSVAEMEFMVRRAEDYKICSECVTLFNNRILDAQRVAQFGNKAALLGKHKLFRRS